MLEIYTLPAKEIGSKLNKLKILYFSITKHVNYLIVQNKNARLISISNSASKINFKAKVIKIKIEPQAAHTSNSS